MTVFQDSVGQGTGSIDAVIKLAAAKSGQESLHPVCSGNPIEHGRIHEQELSLLWHRNLIGGVIGAAFS